MRSGSFGSALAMVLAVAACAGCGSSGSSKVSPGTYVSAVCSAISPLERDVVSRSSALNSTTAPNATEAKKALQGFLVAVEADAARALSKVQSAGTPDISNGKTVAGTITKTFTELRDTLRAAVTKSKSLPTGSPTAFKTAAQALGANVRTSLNGINSSGLTNPELQKAAAGEHACKSLANS